MRRIKARTRIVGVTGGTLRSDAIESSHRIRSDPPCDYFEPGAPVGDKGIVRKLTFFGGSGDPLKKRILPHHAPPQSWKQESIYRIIAAPIRVYYGIIRIDRAESS
jgi:hypothetical protein